MRDVLSAPAAPMQRKSISAFLRSDTFTMAGIKVWPREAPQDESCAGKFRSACTHAGGSAVRGGSWAPLLDGNRAFGFQD